MISEVGRTMLFDCSVSNKAEYENWVAQLGKLYSEHPDTLLFPISYSYEGVGVCGEGGIVHVALLNYCRFSILCMPYL